MGEHYFASHKSGYEEPGLMDDYDCTFLNPKIEQLTEQKFIHKYNNEMGTPPYTNDASFSDAYRHAGLLNIHTYEVVDPATFGIELHDHVFTWPIIETLPKVLKDTPFIAIHADTEGEFSLLFPLASSYGVTHVGGYRKTLRHYKKKSSHRKGTRRHGRRTHRNLNINT